MSSSKKSVVWTLKVDRKFDSAVQDAVSRLGYTGKAELTREAIREFLIRRKLFSLLDGEPIIPLHPTRTPDEALNRLLDIFKGLSSDTIRDEIRKARDDVSKEFLE
ncbi:MAG: hypothetical protein ACXAC7_09800 [Candidatus Hodarchaeales archaeon]|jgi:hypothetical protein